MFGTDGKPVLNLYGVHKGTSVYDERGNLTEHGLLRYGWQACDK